MTAKPRIELQKLDQTLNKVKLIWIARYLLEGVYHPLWTWSSVLETAETTRICLAVEFPSRFTGNTFVVGTNLKRTAEFTIINVRPVRSSRCGTLIKNRVGFVFLPEWPRHSQAKYSCSKLTNNICYLFPSRKPNARKKTTSNTTLFYLRSFQTQRCGHPVLLPRLHSILFGKIL